MVDEAKQQLRKAVDALSYWINSSPCSLTSPEWRKVYEELSEEVVQAFRRIDPNRHIHADRRSS